MEEKMTTPRLSTASATRIPLEVLLGNPERAAVQISPDGTKIGFIAPRDGVLNVWVGDRDADLDDFQAMTNDRTTGVRSWFWSQDSRRILFLKDTDGDEDFHLRGIDLASGQETDYTPFEGTRAYPGKRSRKDPEKMMVSLNRENPDRHEPYRLDLATGALEKLADNPGNILGWTLDEDLVVRQASVGKPDGGRVMRVRDSADDEWRDLFTMTMEEVGISQTLQFDADGSGLYMIDTRNRNAAAFVRMDLADGSTKEIYAEDRYDVTGVVFDRTTSEPIIAVVLRENIALVPLDDRYADDIAMLETLGVDGTTCEVVINSRSDDDRYWTLSVDTSERSPYYLLYDRTEKTHRTLFSMRPALDDYNLAPMESFAFDARDGLRVEGYVTFPPEAERTNLPMVVNVHGGPWTRDTWGYHPEAQWLANRGFICMQVNYRGSTGYGNEFMNAGNREWGGKMHDDLIDAIGWAVEKGYADRDRVAIYGGSYGGFAALVGATMTPEVFRCSVALVGPSNLISFINSIPEYWKPMLAMLKKRVGDPETEPDFLKSRSPLTHVDQIAIPMLVAHGANDPRVKQAESEQIVAAMKEKGIDHAYMLFTDEGHGFARPENRLKFYEAADEFLATHVGDTAASGDAVSVEADNQVGSR